MSVTVRPVRDADHDAVWAILEPVIRAGDTYALPADMGRDAAFDYWCATANATCVAHDETGAILGTYYLKANQAGGGSHVCNCGYMVAANAQGKGVARAMCAHSLDLAREKGFRAMQFNCVVETNTRAIALWEKMGFSIAGRLPGAFAHPREGYVDALVMYRAL